MTEIGADYGSLADLLNRSGSPVPLSELHGGLCGVICASGRGAAQSWLESLLEDCIGDAESLGQLMTRLQSLENETWSALNGFSLEFAPLLPDDDSRVEQRAEALALWCHGFLAGLVVGGLEFGADDGALSPEFNELVRDFAEIGKAGASPDEVTDTHLSDRALLELEEYVRVGAQLMFEELTRGTGVGDQRKLH